MTPSGHPARRSRFASGLRAVVAALALINGPAAQAGVGLADLPPADLVLPPAPTPTTTGAADTIAVSGPVRLVGVVAGVRSYEMPLPVRPRVMFLSSMPPGMEVRRGDHRLGFSDEDSRAGTWGYSAHGLIIRVAKDAERPDPSDLNVRWPDAEKRQSALDTPPGSTPAVAPVDGASDSPSATADTDRQAGARRSLQVGTMTRTGVLLPAPASIAWQVDVPTGGVLRFEAGIVPPEVARGGESDGTNLVVTVGGKDRATFRLERGRFSPFEVALGAEGGTTARIGFRVEDAITTADYAFIAEPRVVVPTPTPKRVVFAFIDTLRRDHLGTYGYSRDTTPTIDALGKRGAVFEDARTVAPWTLPSSRSVLTGNNPEKWSSSARIQEVLASRGWATGAYVGNVYLTSGFDMASGWGEHNSVNLAYGDYEAERGIDFLGRHADEDAMVMVHFMDLHLPYKELWPWRDRYVSEELPGLGDMFNRTALMGYARGRGKRDQVKAYLEDRYDQNLAFVDHELARVFAAAGPDALIVVFADHGEEFFDHGDLEHGHSLYDELLRVPLVIAGPGIAPRRVSAPVSLLDVTPTVLDLLGLGGGEYDGTSLAHLMNGDVDPKFTNRARAFGRLLYGPNAWASLVGDQKWVSRGGDEVVYDLSKDPGEKSPTVDPDRQPGRKALADALGVPTRLVLRVTPGGNRGSGTVTLTVPGGVASVWLGDEPTNHAKCKTSIIANAPDANGVASDTVSMDFSTTGAAEREVYVLPKLDPTIAVQGAVLAVPGGESETLVARSPDAGSGPLAKVTKSTHSFVATWAELPQPFGDELSGFDAESAAALRALGYLDADHDAGSAADDGHAN